MLNLIENAINKNNYYVAKKYLNEYRFEVNILKLLILNACNNMSITYTYISEY